MNPPTIENMPVKQPSMHQIFYKSMKEYIRSCYDDDDDEHWRNNLSGSDVAGADTVNGSKYKFAASEVVSTVQLHCCSQLIVRKKLESNGERGSRPDKRRAFKRWSLHFTTARKGE